MMKKRIGIAMEERIIEELDKEVRERRIGSNRSQAIEYCVSQVLELEKHEKRYIEFLIDFLKIVEEHPEVGENLRRFLEEGGVYKKYEI